MLAFAPVLFQTGTQHAEPETARGQLSKWVYRLLFLPTPVMAWLFAAYQYMRIRQRFNMARRLAEASESLREQDGAAERSPARAGQVDRSIAYPTAAAGKGQYGVVAARLDWRLLSYLIIYLVWSLVLIPVLIYCAWFIDVSYDLVIVGFVLFSVGFPLAGIANFFVFFHHTHRAWASELKRGAKRMLLPSRGALADGSSPTQCDPRMNC